MSLTLQVLFTEPQFVVGQHGDAVLMVRSTPPTAREIRIMARLLPIAATRSGVPVGLLQVTSGMRKLLQIAPNLELVSALDKLRREHGARIRAALIVPSQVGFLSSAARMVVLRLQPSGMGALRVEPDRDKALIELCTLLNGPGRPQHVPAEIEASLATLAARLDPNAPLPVHEPEIPDPARSSPHPGPRPSSKSLKRI